MARKSEQQLTLEEQHRLWMGKLRKARTLQQQATIAKILKDIEARLWPNPVDEAVAVAKAAKLQMKAQKVAAAEAKKVEAAELEREKRIERQKVRDESNPVIEQLRRGRIQAEQRKEQSSPVAEVVISDVVPSEDVPTVNLPLEAPETGAQPAGVVVSPEMQRITRDAEEAAKRQSSTTRVDVDFFERVMKPLESRDVAAPLRREYEGCDFDPIRQEVAPPSEPVDGGAYLTEWNWTPKKW